MGSSTGLLGILPVVFTYVFRCWWWLWCSIQSLRLKLDQGMTSAHLPNVQIVPKAAQFIIVSDSLV